MSLRVPIHRGEAISDVRKVEIVAVASLLRNDKAVCIFVRRGDWYNITRQTDQAWQFSRDPEKLTPYPTSHNIYYVSFSFLS